MDRFCFQFCKPEWTSFASSGDTREASPIPEEATRVTFVGNDQASRSDRDEGSLKSPWSSHSRVQSSGKQSAPVFEKKNQEKIGKVSVSVTYHRWNPN